MMKISEEAKRISCDRKMKTTTVVLDIETVAQPLDSFPESCQDYIQERFKGQRKDRTIEDMMCLDPDFGQIVTIQFFMFDNVEKTGGITLQEPDLLHDFWSFMGGRSNSNPTIVTFNGKSFDIPYILKRSAYLGVKPTINIPTKRYSTSPHFDIAEVLSGFDMSKMKKLGIYCDLFGIKHKIADANKVGEWFRNGEFDRITKHCREDVRATAELYEKIKDYY